MKTRHYIREETDTFDEVNKVFNELRDEIVDEITANDKALGELQSRILQLEKKKTEKKQPSVKKK